MLRAIRNLAIGMALALPVVAVVTHDPRPEQATADHFTPGEEPPPMAVKDRLRDLFYAKVELTAEEKEAVRRMIHIMPELAGDDGFFNLGDIPAITRSLQPGPLPEGVRPEELKPWTGAKAVIARSVARGQLKKGLEESGVTEAKKDPHSARAITLDQLKQYGADSDLLKEYKARCKEAGLPEVTFPQGISVDDLRAILHGRTPPNAKVQM